jgi:hypothetical protein
MIYVPRQRDDDAPERATHLAASTGRAIEVGDRHVGAGPLPGARAAALESEATMLRDDKWLDVFIAATALPLAMFLLALALALSGCATFKVRQSCREQCEPERGPVHTWYGGPTLPPERWDACMSACESEAAP